MAGLLVALEGLLLVLQWLIAGRAGEPLGSILRAQAVFWAMAYAVTPALMLWLSPDARFNDAFADARLAAVGYVVGLAKVMPLVLLGQLVFTGLAGVYAALRSSALTRDPMQVSQAGLFVTFIAGAAARALWLAGAQASVVEALLPLGTIVAALALIYSRGTDWPARTLRALVMLSEVIWSVEYATKTPLIAVAVALIIRLSWSHVPGFSRRKAAGIVVLAIVGFLVVQGVKTDSSTQRDISQAADAYPTVLRPAMPVLIRFDLLHAVTDVAYIPQGSWVTLPEFFNRLAYEVVPRPIAVAKDTLTPGQRWAIEVRAQTLGDPPTTVSLAEGPIAEGYAVAGDPGLVIEVALLFAATVLCSWLLKRSSLLLVAWGVSMITQPILLERGLLGFTGLAVRGFELALVIWLIASLTNSLVPRPYARRAASSRAARLPERAHV